MKKILSVWAIVLMVFALYGQPSSLYYMTNLRQTIYTNPARVSNCSCGFSFPALSAWGGIFSNPVTYSDIFGRTDTTYYIDLKNLANVLGDNNYLLFDARQDFWTFGFWIQDFYIHFSTSLVASGALNYPKSIFELLAYGNQAPYNNVDFSGLGLNTMAYEQTAINVGYKLMPNLTVGGALKFYRGLFNFATNSFTATASVDTSYTNNYPVTINASYDFNISGPFRMGYDTAGIFQFGVLHNPWEITPNNDTIFHLDSLKRILRPRNFGFGIDLGIVYKPIDQVELSASIIDLGFITWKDAGYSLSANADQVVFDGVDIFDTAKTQALIDTFLMQIQPNIDNSPYKKSLYTKVYLGAAYTPFSSLTLGLHYRGTHIGSTWFNVYTAGLYWNPGKWSFSLNYSIYPNSKNNLGAGMQLDLGLMQVYFLMDNISIPYFGLSYFTSSDVPPDQNKATLWVKNTSLINFMFGLNFKFGCKDRTDYGLLD